MKAKQQDEDSLLMDYLLGKLPQAEEIRIEEQYVADASLQDKIAQIEDELVDLYLEKQLSLEEHTYFEAHFLSSPRGRRKLEFARSLASVTSEVAKANAAAPKPAIMRLLRLFTRFPFRFGLAATALIMLLLFGWLLRERASRSNRQNQSNSSPSYKSEPAPGHTESPQVISAASIILEPVSREVVRSPKIKLHSSTDQLRVQLQIHGNRKIYAASLVNTAGQVEWSNHGLQTQVTSSGRSLVLTFPTLLLESGEYRILLCPAESPAMPVAEYSFVVQKIKEGKNND